MQVTEHIQLIKLVNVETTCKFVKKGWSKGNSRKKFVKRSKRASTSSYHVHVRGLTEQYVLQWEFEI